MKIDFELEFEDWALFVIHVNRTDPASMRLGRMFRYGFGGLYLAFAAFAFSQSMWISGTALALLGFAWLVLYPRIAVARIVKQLRKRMDQPEHGKLLGRYGMELEVRGLKVTAHGAHSEIPWGLFTGVLEVEERAFLHLGTQKAVIIPLRADGARAFVDTCGGYISGAGDPAPEA